MSGKRRWTITSRCNRGCTRDTALPSAYFNPIEKAFSKALLRKASERTLERLYLIGHRGSLVALKVATQF